MLITLDDADRLRQWFDAICDVNPQFLDSEDYRLGLSLYDACGMRPSDKLQKDATTAPAAAKPVKIEPLPGHFDADDDWRTNR